METITCMGCGAAIGFKDRCLDARDPSDEGTMLECARCGQLVFLAEIPPGELEVEGAQKLSA